MERNNNSLIWQFQKPDSETLNYLIGTMHVRDSSAFGFMPVFQDKINECQIYAAEMPLDQAEYTDVNSHLLLPDNQTLSDILPKAHYRRLNVF
ncbi:MAG: TraB/GumN family protein [Saprospiraceae bacterium]|nr:TraB/GumN family protein [Saprospiraceae bacterium]